MPRSKSVTQKYIINGRYANFLDRGDPYDNGLTPVGFYNDSLQGNFQTSSNASPYGAYDMVGNVYEWVSDLFQNYSEGAVTNLQGAKRGSWHVIRGSAFLYETFKQRSVNRGSYYFSFWGEYIGSSHFFDKVALQGFPITRVAHFLSSNLDEAPVTTSSKVFAIPFPKGKGR